MGVKNWLAYSHHRASIRTQTPFHFLLPYGPVTNDGAPGCYLEVSNMSHCRAPLTGTLTTPGTLGLLMGAHLVTTGGHVHSCSTNQALQGAFVGPSTAVLGLFALRWADISGPVIYGFPTTSLVSSRFLAEGTWVFRKNLSLMIHTQNDQRVMGIVLR